jgi:cell division protein FtsB
MKDNTNKANEMIIYQTDCGMNTIDVYHLIQSQVGTINNQAKVIKLLEENNKLKDKVRKLSDECAQLEDALHRHPDDY